MKLNINDEQGIELLHFIFERELKPPFKEGYKDKDGYCRYYNRNNEHIGWLFSPFREFALINPFFSDIKDKVCYAFGLFNEREFWLHQINPHLKSWMENQINVKLKKIY